MKSEIEVALRDKAMNVPQSKQLLKSNLEEVDKMQKLKTNKGARKRLKITKNGKLMRYKAGKRHILTSKSSKRKRKMRRCVEILGMEAKITKKLLPYG